MATSPAAPGDAAGPHLDAVAATIAAVLRATALPGPLCPPPAVDSARLAAFLDRHPGWSVFWDKRYGLWRATEDDPGSALYIETPDAGTVISYITDCSRPAADSLQSMPDAIARPTLLKGAHP